MVEFGENGAVVTPQSEVGGYQAARVSDKGYPNGPRPVQTLSKWLIGGLKVFLVLEFVTALISIFLIWLYSNLDTHPFNNQQLGSMDAFISITSLIYLVAYVFCIVMTCRVTYRFMRNLHTIGNQQAEISPGWAVGWHFIPFANLVMPARAMSQIYHGTYAAVGEKPKSASPISLWWAFWIISNITANVSLRLSGGFNSNTPGIFSFSLDLISSITGLISALALIRIVRDIATRQELLKHGGVANVFD